MHSDVKKEFAAVRKGLRRVSEHARDVDTRLSTAIARIETTLRQEIREEGITTRRHFDVMAESLRDDIRIIAEGLVTLDAKVETMRKV